MRYKKILFAGLAAWMSLSSFAFDLKTESPVIIKGDTTQMAPVAKTALKMLQGDIKKVLGSEMKLQMSSLSKTSDKNESSEGSSDKNIIILSKDAAAFAYKKEAFQIKAENGNLYIKGSDDHGLAYGILEVSRLLGGCQAEASRRLLPEGWLSQRAGTIGGVPRHLHQR